MKPTSPGRIFKILSELMRGGAGIMARALVTSVVCVQKSAIQNDEQSVGNYDVKQMPHTEKARLLVFKHI
jgi:hypothetical protein